MSELKPCPLCGGDASLEGGNETLSEGACWWVQCRNTECFCSIGCHYLSDDGASASEAWNRRAQPAQAGPVYQDLKAMANAVWAQAEHEKAPEAFATGAAGSTERSSVLARQSIIAQAVPLLLSDDPLFVFAQEVIHGAYKPEELKDAAMRAIRHHSAVRAKLGVAVPMTHMQIVMLWGHRSDGPSTPEIVSFARLVERHHGIVGKEGA